MTPETVTRQLEQILIWAESEGTDARLPELLRRCLLRLQVHTVTSRGQLH